MCKICRLVFSLVCCVLLFACCMKNSIKTDKIALVEIKPIENENLSENIYENMDAISEVRSYPFSVPILVLADNQIHDIFNMYAFFYRTNLADDIAGCAIRPPILDFFNYNGILLSKALENYDKPNRLILHLGDAADMSTANELYNFFELMNKCGSTWFMAPGNHDGFYYGMSNPFKFGKEWEKASTDIFRSQADADTKNNIGGQLTKDRFVASYLAALILQPNAPWAETLKSELDVNIKDLRFNKETYCDVVSQIYNNDIKYNNQEIYEKEIDFSKIKNSRLDKLKFHINRNDIMRGQSYIMQSLKINDNLDNISQNVYIIVLDTSSYKSWRTVFHPFIPWSWLSNEYNAGVWGEIGKDQACVMKSWTDSYSKDSKWILAGHHPYKSIKMSKNVKEAFNVTLNKGKLPYFISAHTHSGNIFRHDDKFTEINVGSIVDYPMEYRDFQLRIDSISNVHIQSNHYSLINSFLSTYKDQPNYIINSSYLDYMNSNGNSREIEIVIKTMILDVITDILNQMKNEGLCGSCEKEFKLVEDSKKVINRLKGVPSHQIRFDNELEELQAYLLELNEIIRDSKFLESEVGEYYAMKHSCFASKAEHDVNGRISKRRVNKLRLGKATR